MEDKTRTLSSNHYKQKTRYRKLEEYRLEGTKEYKKLENELQQIIGNKEVIEK